MCIRDRDYVVPGNDDAIRAIRLYVAAVADAITQGKASTSSEVGLDEFVEVEESPAAATTPADAPEAAPATEAPAAPEALAALVEAKTGPATTGDA